MCALVSIETVNILYAFEGSSFAAVLPKAIVCSVD